MGGSVPTWLRLTLLALTILGGLYGLVETTIFSIAGVSGIFSLFVLVILISAYAFITVAGIIFWRKPETVRPLHWALGMQIPWISCPGIVYQLSTGMYLMVGFLVGVNGENYSAGFATKYNIGSSYELRLFQLAPFGLGINLIALTALLLLRSFTVTASRSEA